ncbi:hypothetical protein AGABI2DRAFT_192227 [Agaricus bisporus var. bisporus H97]|uniref:hypothetical protein n=1 Tax=Agaricus bisporus var. bisporus (strain H97 / ATCC MYA-4626 / FGSC 10389) TaxID=936046 RepID=UPI00029F6239|nr:hypothetical protein AGABI2DRAFT_192227 [Agaricus bisporus var. bisporus H97]EKV48699.1 hypothetical protein AGABI2DRAFT_192227 [Agaricus bisporus var. bisporus H97]
MASSDAVTTKLTFLLPPSDGSRPYQSINIDTKTGVRDRNIVPTERNVSIENVRGKEHLYKLDEAGFQFDNRPTAFTDFRDDEKVVKEYYPESIELIKELTGASRVVLFDHTRRLRNPDQVGETPDTRQPVAQAHVDQTKKSSVTRVHRHLPAEDVPELLRHRFQILNLWRPIGNPALEWPLALCDFRSVDPDNDTYPVALVYPDHEGETMSIKPSDKHEWKYLRGMTPDEIVLIKCFDSVEDGSVSRFTPHTGFEDPTTPKGAPHRESIELRALVFYDN